MLSLLSISKMNPELKRQHIIGIFKLVGYDLQKNLPERQYLFPEIVTFLDEQRGEDEDIKFTNNPTGFR